MKRPLFLVDQPVGQKAARACRFDRRFSYFLYVPKSFTNETASEYRILVAVHGSSRVAEFTRDMYSDLADQAKLIVLSPLFPIAVTEREEIQNYLFIEFEGIRFDKIVLAMIDEVCATYGVPSDQIGITGFSAGGQFSHRFFYLYPQRVAAVSVGAPGMVTLLDPEADWYTGIRDVEKRFGRKIDIAALRGVPIQIVVGGDDVSPDEIMLKPDHILYAPGVNDAGRTRVERAQTLHNDLTAKGLDASIDIVPGAGHASDQVLLAVESFFRRAFGALDRSAPRSHLSRIEPDTIG